MILGSGLDGLDTYRRILETRPGQRTILASGYSDGERVRQAQTLGAGAYIKKPYTLETLAVVVKDELSRL
jgi:DNA-binding NtrC family response regulator